VASQPSFSALTVDGSSSETRKTWVKGTAGAWGTGDGTGREGRTSNVGPTVHDENSLLMNSLRAGSGLSILIGFSQSSAHITRGHNVGAAPQGSGEGNDVAIMARARTRASSALFEVKS
jgi:hypothetical protein